MCRLREVAILKFTKASYAFIIEDAVKGEIKYTFALSSMYGCNKDGQINVSNKFRKDYLLKYLNNEITVDKSLSLAVDFNKLATSESNCSGV